MRTRAVKLSEQAYQIVKKEAEKRRNKKMPYPAMEQVASEYIIHFAKILKQNWKE